MNSSKEKSPWKRVCVQSLRKDFIGQSQMCQVTFDPVLLRQPLCAHADGIPRDCRTFLQHLPFGPDVMTMLYAWNRTRKRPSVPSFRPTLAFLKNRCKDAILDSVSAFRCESYLCPCTASFQGCLKKKAFCAISSFCMFAIPLLALHCASGSSLGFHLQLRHHRTWNRWRNRPKWTARPVPVRDCVANTLAWTRDPNQ